VDQRALGGTGIEISRLVLGCGNFGGIGSAPAFFGQGESREEAFAIMDAAWELGITTFDTADAYGGGRSETWIGEWRRSKGPQVRDALVLTTKVFHSVLGVPGDVGLAPARIRRAVEGSLNRLGVERIDLYLTHEPDPDTPLEDTLGALDELVRSGKIGAVGGSNVGGEQVRGYAFVQNSYSLLDRAAEDEVLPLCARDGLGFEAFGPLAGGWLTGKYRRGKAAPAGSRMSQRPEPYLHLDDERVYRGLDELERRARERGTTMAALAIAWLLADERVTGVVVGPRRPEQLAPAVEALELPVVREELSALF
jgi:aryl-alcohol dehydrogenase-like predicted oxidoreductase